MKAALLFKDFDASASTGTVRVRALPLFSVHRKKPSVRSSGSPLLMRLFLCILRYFSCGGMLDVMGLGYCDFG